MEKKSLSHSMFTMWRCVVAIAHADGKLVKEELDHFEKLFENLLHYFDLTQHQRNVFAEDLYAARNIDELFSEINEPEARDTLAGFAADLAWIDGDLDPAEEKILKRLHLYNLPGYDRAALLDEIRTSVRKNKHSWDKERAQLRSEAQARNPYFRAIDLLLSRLGMDVLK